MWARSGGGSPGERCVGVARPAAARRRRAGQEDRIRGPVERAASVRQRAAIDEDVGVRGERQRSADEVDAPGHRERGRRRGEAQRRAGETDTALHDDGGDSGGDVDRGARAAEAAADSDNGAAGLGVQRDTEPPIGRRRCRRALVQAAEPEVGGILLSMRVLAPAERLANGSLTAATPVVGVEEIVPPVLV